MDVAESELEELFKRTVGPIKEIFIIYNNQGRPKGMAVVTFQRATDAVSARSKYDGKVIDGKHKLKIELVTDSDEPLPEAVKEQPSLLSRISGHTRPESNAIPSVELSTPPPQRPRKNHTPLHTPSIFVAGPKKRTKKGPKRIKKSVAQLDQDMEDYRASTTDRKVA
jgi:THO complex subunit 4